VQAQHKRGEIGFELNNPNYTDGRSKKINYCQCGKQTSDYRNKLCLECFRKKLVIINKTSNHKRVIPKPRYGQDHWNWKGNKVGYKGIHIWLIKTFGKATKCDNPNCPKKSKVFQWAKLRNKEYERKRENFFQLCRSCHILYDNVK